MLSDDFKSINRERKVVTHQNENIFTHTFIQDCMRLDAALGKYKLVPYTYHLKNTVQSVANQFAEKNKFSSLVPSKKVLASVAFVAAVVVIAYVYRDALYDAGVFAADKVKELFNKIYYFLFESEQEKAQRLKNDDLSHLFATPIKFHIVQ